MIAEIIKGEIYYSKSGRPFKVLHLARHGQQCEWSMVVYTNLEHTLDSPKGTIWTIAESIFLKNFKEL